MLTEQAQAAITFQPPPAGLSPDGKLPVFRHHPPTGYVFGSECAGVRWDKDNLVVFGWVSKESGVGDGTAQASQYACLRIVSRNGNDVVSGDFLMSEPLMPGELECDGLGVRISEKVDPLSKKTIISLTPIISGKPGESIVLIRR